MIDRKAIVRPRLMIGSAMTAALLLTGCAVMRGPTGTISRDVAARSDNWRDVATTRDRERLSHWWASWTAALAGARAAGNGAAIDREGDLLRPAAALPNPHLPPGEYDCRVIKLGAQARGGLAYVSYPQFRCRVEAEQDIFSFTKLSGSQRPVGLLFDDSETRKIFLGTLMLGDEARAIDYGTDPGRDMAGILERVGPQRWRLVFPEPAFESLLDVIEITPVIP